MLQQDMKSFIPLPHFTGSGRGAVGSVLAWGARGREFESRRSDKTEKQQFSTVAFFLPVSDLGQVKHMPSLSQGCILGAYLLETTA